MAIILLFIFWFLNWMYEVIVERTKDLSSSWQSSFSFLQPNDEFSIPFILFWISVGNIASYKIHCFGVLWIYVELMLALSYFSFKLNLGKEPSLKKCRNLHCKAFPDTILGLFKYLVSKFLFATWLSLPWGEQARSFWFYIELLLLIFFYCSKEKAK